MTDKEKIRAEIEARISDIEISQKAGLIKKCNAETKIIIYNGILSFIDSMQEEPKKCMYSKDDYTDEDRKVLCDGCKEKCEYIKKEEPVSEDLEEAANAYAVTIYSNYLDNPKAFFENIDADTLNEDAFKAGAKWQKAKDESTTEDLGEYINELSKQFPEVSFAKLSRIVVRVAKWQKEKDKNKVLTEEQCRKIRDDAFELGKDAMKQQLMKDAVEATVTDIRAYKDENEVDFSVMYEKGLIPYEIEQEVKLLVLKEE